MSAGASYDITATVAAAQNWMLSKPKAKSELDDVPLESLVPLKKLTLDDQNEENLGKFSKKRKSSKKDKKQELTFVVQPTSYRETKKMAPAKRYDSGFSSSSIKTTNLSPSVEMLLTWLHERVRCPPGPPFLPYDDGLLLSAIENDPEIGLAFDTYGGICGLLALKPEMFEIRDLGFGRPGFKTDFDHLPKATRKMECSQAAPSFGKFSAGPEEDSALGYGVYDYGSMRKSSKNPESEMKSKKSGSAVGKSGAPVPVTMEYGQFSPRTEASSNKPGAHGQKFPSLMSFSGYGGPPCGQNPESSDGEQICNDKYRYKAVLDLVNSEFGFVHTENEVKSYVVSCCRETGLDLNAPKSLTEPISIIVNYIRAKNAHENEDLCPICLERASQEQTSIVKTEKTECGHPFHSHCLTKWCSQNSVCPVCRTYLVSQDEFPNL